MPETVVVPVKSSFASKINWTQAVGAAGMLLTMYGVNLSPDKQAAIVTVIGLVTQVATWIQRTWFTTSITEASKGA